MRREPATKAIPGRRRSLGWWTALGIALAAAVFAVSPAVATAAQGDFSGKPGAAQSNGPRGGEQTSQGVVQSVLAKAIVLKELDGSSVSVPIDARTRFLVDGKRASLRDVKPGFVATATWKAGEAAREVQALDPSHSTSGHSTGGRSTGGSKGRSSAGELRLLLPG